MKPTRKPQLNIQLEPAEASQIAAIAVSEHLDRPSQVVRRWVKERLAKSRKVRMEPPRAA